MLYAIGGIVGLGIYILTLILWDHFASARQRKHDTNMQQLLQQLMQPPPTIDLSQIYTHIDQIPNKVLMSITNSTNTYKGALGELVGYIELKAAYDRIIPLGSIVDFVAIKLPTKDNPGCIDFVDVKTGHKARLSKDQKALQQLIKDKKINFCQLKVDATDKIKS